MLLGIIPHHLGWTSMDLTFINPTVLSRIWMWSFRDIKLVYGICSRFPFVVFWLKRQYAISAWFLPVVLTHIHTPCIFPSHQSHSWYQYATTSQGKMQFDIHLVNFALSWNIFPFQTKWEIPFLPLSSDLTIFGRSAAFNHKDAN